MKQTTKQDLQDAKERIADLEKVLGFALKYLQQADIQEIGKDFAVPISHAIKMAENVLKS